MNKTFYLILATLTIFLSSCFKQSITDAMLNSDKQGYVTATLSYEVNGNPVKITVKNADHQVPGYRTLYCEKTGSSYLLSGVGDYGELVFTFFTDSLKVGNYKYTGTLSPIYVTDFQGPNYVAGPTDNMNFNITSYKDGHISGNFTGQLSTATSFQNYPNISFGAFGGVVIKNGIFNNVPVFY
jgi:hypothetical protein